MTASTAATSPNPDATVCVLVDRRYERQAQPARVVRRLVRLGCSVRVVVADDEAHDLCDVTSWRGVDVVLARGRSSALLGLVRTAELAGVPVVLSSTEVHRVVDKAGMATALAVHGVPTPRTWIGSPRSLARRSDITFPLVLKPLRGDNARGLVVVHDRVELAGTPWAEGAALAQHFHRGDGFDLKLYVVGDRVWAVRRPSPIDADGAVRQVGDDGERVEVTPVLRRIATRCAEAFGLQLLGIDVVGDPGSPLVVEVNEFPTYRGVGKTADKRIAQLVLAAARAARTEGAPRPRPVGARP